VIDCFIDRNAIGNDLHFIIHSFVDVIVVFVKVMNVFMVVVMMMVIVMVERETSQITKL